MICERFLQSGPRGALDNRFATRTRTFQPAFRTLALCQTGSISILGLNSASGYWDRLGRLLPKRVAPRHPVAEIESVPRYQTSAIMQSLKWSALKAIGDKTEPIKTHSLAMDIKLLRSSASALFSSRRFNDSSRIYLEIASALERIDMESSEHLGALKDGSIDPVKALKINAATCNIKARNWQTALQLCNQVLNDETDSSVSGLSESTMAKALYTRALSRWQVEGMQETSSQLSC